MGKSFEKRTSEAQERHLAKQQGEPPPHQDGVRYEMWHDGLPDYIKALPVPSATFVINTRNEGPDVAETIKSIRGNYSGRMEVIVIADGTTDGSCDNLGPDVRVILKDKPVGCGKAKSIGAKLAKYDIIFHGDGHHRVIRGSIDDMARLAMAMQAIVCPCLPPLRCAPDEQPEPDHKIKHESYGAELKVNMLPKVDPYGSKPKGSITRTPGASFAFFCYPRKVLIERLGGWNEYPGNWGSQEIGLSLRAWFADVPVYCMRDVAVAHRFRSWNSGKNKYAKLYSTPRWQSKANSNYASRVVFAPETIERVWSSRLPVDSRVTKALAESALDRQHAEFQKVKRRTDREFFETFAPELLKPMLPLEQITAIILSWKRPQSAQRCVDSLRKCGLENIWVWCQENIEPPEGASVVMSCSANLGTWPRYAVAGLAQTSHVIFIDDDTLISAAGMDALRTGAMEFPDRNVGLFGMRFKAPFNSYHKRSYFKSHNIDAPIEVDMLWPKGQIIPAQLVQRTFGHADVWNRMREAVGGNTGDDFVCFVAQQLIGEKSPIVMPSRLKGLKELKDEAPKYALHRYPPGRYRSKAATFNIWREMGWKPLNMESYKPMDFDSRCKLLKEHGTQIKQSMGEFRPAWEEVQKLRPKCFLEIGSKQGGSLFMYAAACEPGAHLIIVDQGKHQRDRIQLKRTIDWLEGEGFHITWVRGGSQNLASRDAARAAIGDGPLVALHIDADHKYRSVSKDYSLYSELVAPGGIILLHDIVGCPGVTKFWTELGERKLEREEWVQGFALASTKPHKEQKAGIGMVRIPNTNLADYDTRVSRLKEMRTRMLQHPNEARNAYAELAKIQPKRFLEIGCRHGGSLYTYAGACAPGAHLIAVELAEDRLPRIRLKRVLARLESEGYKTSWVRGKSQDEGAYEAVKASLDGPLDALHIDGDHAYDMAKKDYELYGALVRPGGIICFHDVDEPNQGVHKLWKELEAQGLTESMWACGRMSKWTKRAGIGLMRKPA